MLRVGNLNAGGRYGVSDSLSVSTTASGKQVGKLSEFNERKDSYDRRKESR